MEQAEERNSLPQYIRLSFTSLMVTMEIIIEQTDRLLERELQGKKRGRGGGKRQREKENRGG